MSKTPASNDLIPSEQLSGARQIELRDEYGHYLDTLPPTCSIETKTERFRHWLEKRGIDYKG